MTPSLSSGFWFSLKLWSPTPKQVHPLEDSSDQPFLDGTYEIDKVDVQWRRWVPARIKKAKRKRRLFTPRPRARYPKSMPTQPEAGLSVSMSRCFSLPKRAYHMSFLRLPSPAEGTAPAGMALKGTTRPAASLQRGV